MKNTKIDMIWIIPEILGGLGIAAAGAVKMINTLKNIDGVPILEWLFYSTLGMIVLEYGITFLSVGVKELILVFRKDELRKTKQKRGSA